MLENILNFKNNKNLSENEEVNEISSQDKNFLSKKPYEKRIEKFREKSPENLKNIIEHDFGREFTEEEKKEIQKIKTEASVVVGCSISTLLKVFENNKFKSIIDLQEISKIRKMIPNVFNSNQTFRINLEKKLGIQPSGGKNDPELTYGAIFNGEEALGRGGEAMVVLKNDKIKNRTTFTFGDSFIYTYYKDYSYKDPPIVTWEEMPTVEFLRRSLPPVNKNTKPYYPRYTEAQIAGDVSVDDISEVKFEVKSENQGEEILNKTEIQKLVEKFPNIKFTYFLEKNNL